VDWMDFSLPQENARGKGESQKNIKEQEKIA